MHKIETYFEAFILIFLIGFFLVVIQGFLMPLLLASTLVFLSYGFHKKLLRFVKDENLSAFIVLLFVLGGILLPFYWISISLVDQTVDLVYGGSDVINAINLDGCKYDFCRSVESNVQRITVEADQIIEKVGGYIISSGGSIFTSVSKFVFDFIVDFFVFLLAFFFLLKDGDKFMRYIKRIIPMKMEYKNALFLRFRDVTSAVFVDSILVAMMQGFLVSLGFWGVGLPSPIFWGVIASFFALIPVMGAPFVWVPAVIYLFFTHFYYAAFFLLLYGAIIVGLSDNIVRPMLIRNKIQVHSFLIMLSILGGIEVFGFAGIFIGPIVICLLVSVFQLYKLDFR